MKIKVLIVILSFISFSILYGMGTWIFNNRSHGELRWSTIKTEHFDVHYHDDIREIAVRGASMAEQIRPILMKQMSITNLPRLDIAFTAEDEVLNGFAVSANYTIIWVDQNDAALWNGDEKWLRTVLAHELQHLVYLIQLRVQNGYQIQCIACFQASPHGLLKVWQSITLKNGDLLDMIFHTSFM